MYTLNSSVMRSNASCTSSIKVVGQFWINCSNLKLKSIPNNNPLSTTHLDLSNNLITKLQAENFKHLANLVYLDMSNNKLHKLKLSSFTTLTKLKVLNISSNNLSSATSFPKGVFKPLSSSLSELDLRHNLMDIKISGQKYPSEALSDLVSLQILKMDCLQGKILQFCK